MIGDLRGGGISRVPGCCEWGTHVLSPHCMPRRDVECTHPSERIGAYRRCAVWWRQLVLMTLCTQSVCFAHVRLHKKQEAARSSAAASSGALLPPGLAKGSSSPRPTPQQRCSRQLLREGHS
eukprot:364683-Chlamydomonas_euryale.AAC.4